MILRAHNGRDRLNSSRIRLWNGWGLKLSDAPWGGVGVHGRKPSLPSKLRHRTPDTRVVQYAWGMCSMPPEKESAACG